MTSFGMDGVRCAAGAALRSSMLVFGVQGKSASRSITSTQQSHEIARSEGGIVKEDIDRAIGQGQRDLEADVVRNHALLAQSLEDEVRGDGIFGITEAPSGLAEFNLLDAGPDFEFPQFFAHGRLPLLDSVRIAW